MQYNGNYDCADFEVIIKAIDEIAEYSIKFMDHKHPEFIKFINDNPDFISKKIDKEHWIYKILKDNIINIEYKQNPLLVPLGEYDYGNSYNDFEFLNNIEKTKKEIIKSLGISQELINPKKREKKKCIRKIYI